MTKRKSPAEVSEGRRRSSMARWHPEAASEVMAKLGGDALRPPVPLHTIDDYDGRIGQPNTWQDAKSRESVVGELIANDVKREEADVRRGKLFTLEQVVDRDRAKNDLFFAQLARVAELVNSLVDPAERDNARHKVQEFVADARRAIAEAIKARTE